MHRTFTATLSLILIAGALHAGGAWVPASGGGDVRVGFSRKTADTSWNAYGDVIHNRGRFENHDFRYYYLAGEPGLGHDLAFTYLITYLNGLEGPDGDLHKNAGFSDAWLGLRYGIRFGRVGGPGTARPSLPLIQWRTVLSPMKDLPPLDTPRTRS